MGQQRPRVRRRRRVRAACAGCARSRRSPQTTEPRKLALAVARARARPLGARARARARRDADASWLRAFKSRLADAACRRRSPPTCPTGCGTGWAHAYGDATRAALARAWLAPAPFDLRVNPLKTTRDEALAALAADGFAAAADALLAARHCASPGRPSLARIRGSPTARLEVQDEGSQLVGYLVAPKRTRHGRRFLRRRRRQDAAARRADALAGTALRVRRRRASASRTSSRGSRARDCRTCIRRCIAHERDTQGQAPRRQDRPRAGRRAVHRLRHAAAQSRPQVAAAASRRSRSSPRSRRRSSPRRRRS